ncbi:hypothetical protein [Alkalihalobacterium chitinilyticum]|uniref:Tetratricopeptide repeat protein n=1 Tax=Alkalihalobacterium chitinilyticum TaxID=2980103 RepID=A0ABT5VIZ8_9BACI|nr:hypothetical protein [Alkalihalobacterium chitinilyticum]MDE5415435.1 hypothetical protein [Alkalihalobacterium chitinilyticum]
MILKFIIAFILGVILTVLLTALGVHPVLSYFVIIFLILFMVLYLPLLLPAYVSRNEKTIEKYLLKNKNHPQLYLFYALGNRMDEDVDETISELLKKHNNKHQKALYHTILHFYNNDFKAASETLNDIRPEKIKEYYKIGVEIELGSLKDAQAAIDRLKEGWVKSSLLAELSNKKGDRSSAIRYANRTLSEVRGLQWYLLYCEYKREYNINAQNE